MRRPWLPLLLISTVCGTPAFAQAAAGAAPAPRSLARRDATGLFAPTVPVPLAAAVAADERALLRFASSTLQEGRRSTGRLVAGGLLGGAIGFFGGGIAGAAINCEGADVEDDLCAVGGFLIGASIAETVLLPLGVHLANDRRGNYAGSLAASTALTGAALWLTSINGDGVYLIPVPPLQLLFSTAIERATGDD